MANIGYRFYFLFIVCNFTNAIFFWLFLPETARRSLETMNAFFTEAPWVVVGKTKQYAPARPRELEEERMEKDVHASGVTSSNHKEHHDF